jgi:hypothetical protein
MDIKKKPQHPAENHQEPQDFVKEQYIQYHEIRRQLNAFSWQVPSLVILVMLYFFRVDAEKIEVWKSIPVISFLEFFILSLFILVMLVFHRRCLLHFRKHEENLAKMEKLYGISCKVYADQTDSSFKWFDRIRSSFLLTLFLVLLFLISISGCIFCFVKCLS